MFNSAQPLSNAATANQNETGFPVLPIPAYVDPKVIPGNPVMITPYRDASGDIQFYTARFIHDGKKKDLPYCWWRYPDGREEWKAKQPLKNNRPLLNLPKIINNPDKPICLGEGEKVANALHKLFPDAVATTSCGGSKAAAKSDWSVIKDRDVILFLDLDIPGREYGENVCKLCKQEDAKSIQVFRMEVFAQYATENGSIIECKRELPGGYDIADTLDEGWTVNLLIQLEQVLQGKGESLFLDSSTLIKSEVEGPDQMTGLRAVNIGDFLSLEIPPRKMILSPILPEQGLVMLYAQRGIGKTYVAISIAYTVAAGSKMFGEKWSCDDPCKVLFVDGEMPASVLQQRLASIIAGAEMELSNPENLRIITPDLQNADMPDLSTEEGQAYIESHLSNVKLLILDNLSALCRTGRENESESWRVMQEWLLSLRRRGISVLIIHHANKMGGQRGTSKKEDLLDTVIELRKNDDYSSEEGAKFKVHYSKARGFYGEEAKPFIACLVQEGESLRWRVEEIEDSLLQEILALDEEGKTQREIAAELGINLSKVNRMLKKANDLVLANK